MMKHCFLLFVFLLCFSRLFAQNYTISGYVQDAKTGEKLINANVYNGLTLKGAVANVYGFYSLTLPAGKVKLTASFVGYKTFVQEMELNSNMVINIQLSSATELTEVVVTDQRKSILNSAQMGTNEVSVQQIKSLPVILGETDILKTIQLLPGVKSGTEGTSGFYVRGGGPDQNLILLDGVPVYNASHLFGFFSVFNADAIQSVTLIKGGYPARFGGRLSSVLDIRMKEGNNKEFHGEGAIGLISSRLTLEGPLFKGKTSYLVSGRRTYIDVLSKPFQKANQKGNQNKDMAGYYFYDLNAKVNHIMSDRSRLYLSAYTGRDKAYVNSEYNDNDNYRKLLEESEASLQWGNLTTALRWNYIISPKLFSNTTITYSKYKFTVGAREYSKEVTDKTTIKNYEYDYSSGIDDAAAKIDFDYSPNINHSIKFGSSYIYHTFNPGINVEKDYSGKDKLDTTYGNRKIYASEFAAYIEDDIDITSKLKLNVGLHYSFFQVKKSFYQSLQPRVSARYLIGSKVAVKASYTEMAQYIHLLTNNTVGLPTDLWLPATDRVKPQLAKQAAMGISYSINNDYDLTFETYYKKMSRLIDYKEGASFFSQGDDWQDKIETDGKGKSYGFEVMLEKKVGKTTGWIGYSIAWTERQYPNIDFGQWFPYRYDKRHDISFVLTHKFSDRIDIGMTWVISSGIAVTLPYENYDVAKTSDAPWRLDKVEYYDNRNNFRMPMYHRMDIGINFHKKKKWGERCWNISAYNAYNRKNPFYIYFSTSYDEATKKDKTVLKQLSLFPIIPSFSYSFKF
jgi:outer membrane receptor for ferrienterochelin and colicin